MTKSLKLLIVALVLALPGGLAVGADKVSPGDEKFVQEAAGANLMEVELGKLAQQKAASPQVKEFGKQMEQDHAKAEQELERIAAGKNIQLPQKLEGKHKATVDRLSKLAGEQFDRAYMKAMIDDHKEDVGKFQQEAGRAKDSEIKNFAGKQVPTLKKHLEMAQSTGQQVGAMSSR